MNLLVKIQLSHILVLVPLALAGAGAALAGTACSSDDASGAGGAGGAGAGNGGEGAATTGPGGPGSSGSGSPSSSSSGMMSSGPGGSIDCGEPPTGSAPPMALTLVASGLERPVFVTGAPGDTSRLFVVEQNGTIRIIRDGVLAQDAFLDVSRSVSAASAEEEFGLLGLAFHPDYAQNGRFFIYYIDAEGETVLAEHTRSGDNADRANAQPTKTLLQLPFYGGHHYGGMLAFGKDGYLYVGVGDHGSEDDAQNINDKRGKILRLDVDTHPAPPPGNLPGGDDHVWHYGLRNPWRFSFDRCSDDMYIGDVGGAFEEINFQRSGQGHLNFGWTTVDNGATCNGAACVGAVCNGMTCPVVAYDHNRDDCSVTGGFVYRGSAIAGMNGRYIYGDWCSARIYSFIVTAEGVTLAEDLSDNLETSNVLASLSSFGEDTAGNLYVLDLIASSIYRIDPE